MENTKLYKRATILGILLMLALPVLFSVLILRLIHNDFERLFYSRIIFWADVAALYFFARQAEKNYFLLWPANKYNARFYPLHVLILYGLSFIASLVSVPFGLHEKNTVLWHLLRIIAQNWWLLVFCAATAGITEELLFRGYLLPRLQLFFKNKYVPVLISSVLFSAMHYRYFSLRETVFTFLIGVIFALHYQKYRNIWVLMITHFLIDFIAFTLGKHGLHKLGLI